MTSLVIAHAGCAAPAWVVADANCVTRLFSRRARCSLLCMGPAIARSIVVALFPPVSCSAARDKNVSVSVCAAFRSQDAGSVILFLDSGFAEDPLVLVLFNRALDWTIPR